MNIIIFAALVSSDFSSDLEINSRYIPVKSRSGVQVIINPETLEYIIFSGRQSSNEYIEGLSIYTYDLYAEYYTKLDIRLNCPEPRSHYGLFYANIKWMYIFGGISLTEIFGDLWRFNLDLLYWEKIFDKSDILPRYNFQYTTIYIDETDSALLVIIGGMDKTDNGLQDFFIINITDIEYEIYEKPSLNESCIDRPLFGGQLKLLIKIFKYAIHILLH